MDAWICDGIGKEGANWITSRGRDKMLVHVYGREKNCGYWYGFRNLGFLGSVSFVSNW